MENVCFLPLHLASEGRRRAVSWDKQGHRTLSVVENGTAITELAAKRQLFLRRTPDREPRAMTVASYYAGLHLC
jgi:hypothetical protein